MGAPAASEPTEEDEPWEMYRKRELLRQDENGAMTFDERRYVW
jgi:hypothetical protein